MGEGLEAEEALGVAAKVELQAVVKEGPVVGVQGSQLRLAQGPEAALGQSRQVQQAQLLAWTESG